MPLCPAGTRHRQTLYLQDFTGKCKTLPCTEIVRHTGATACHHDKDRLLRGLHPGTGVRFAPAALAAWIGTGGPTSLS